MAELSTPPFYVPDGPLTHRRKSSFDSSAAAAAASAFSSSSGSPTFQSNNYLTYNSILLGPHESSYSRHDGRRPSIGTVSLFGMDIINTSMVGGQFVSEDKVESMFNFEPPTSFEDLHEHFNLESIQEEKPNNPHTPSSADSAPSPPPEKKEDESLNKYTVQGRYSGEYHPQHQQHEYNTYDQQTQGSQNGNMKRAHDFDNDDFSKRSRVQDLVHNNVEGGSDHSYSQSLYDSRSFNHTVSPAAMHNQQQNHAAFLENMAATAAEGSMNQQMNGYGYQQHIQHQQPPERYPSPMNSTHPLQHQYQQHMSQHPQMQQFMQNDIMHRFPQRPATPYNMQQHEPQMMNPMTPTRSQSVPMPTNQFMQAPMQHAQYQTYQSQFQHSHMQGAQHQQFTIGNNFNHMQHHGVQYAPQQQPIQMMQNAHHDPKGQLHKPTNPTSPNAQPNGNGALPPEIEPETVDGQKKYKCPKPWCSKVYKNSNGLKYHIEHGNCELDYTSADGAMAAAALEFDAEGNPTSSVAGMPPPGDIKITHRPYWCKVRGCGKKYKNLNGLKYHGKVSHPELDFRLMVKGHSPNV